MVRIKRLGDAAIVSYHFHQSRVVQVASASIVSQHVLNKYDGTFWYFDLKVRRIPMRFATGRHPVDPSQVTKREGGGL